MGIRARRTRRCRPRRCIEVIPSGLITAHTHGHGISPKARGERMGRRKRLMTGPALDINGKPHRRRNKYSVTYSGALEMLMKGCQRLLRPQRGVSPARPRRDWPSAPRPMRCRHARGGWWRHGRQHLPSTKGGSPASSVLPAARKKRWSGCAFGTLRGEPSPLARF